MEPPREEFEVFDPLMYGELWEPTPGHVEYLSRMKDCGKPPLMFLHIPHVLVAGPIEVSGLLLLSWEGEGA